MTVRFLHTTALSGCALLTALAATPAMAQDTATPASAASDEAQPASSGFGQDDIIVTATKRNESIRDVPIAMSAITGEQLAGSNANSLADYINRLPGVVFNDYQPGVSEVVIRGIAATTYHEQGQTTVGYYLNQIPLVEPGFPIGIPDIDTFDLDRVEVLRGPQGTLFGSSTLGGLVDYEVKTADASGVHAAGEGLIGSTHNASGQLNYAGKVMVNLPIIRDVLAVRVMALQRFDAGFADNTGTGVQGSNDFRTRGLRGSVVFTPSAGTKITYLGAYQDTRLDNTTYLTDPDKLIRIAQNPEPQRTSFFLNSLRLEQDLGFADLTAFGSIDHKTNFTQFDSSYYGFLNGHPTGRLAPVSVGHAHANIKQAEARLASKQDGPLRWLIGASYVVARKSSYDQNIAPGAEAYIDANPATVAAAAAAAFVNLAPFPAITGAYLAPGDQFYGYASDSLNKDLGIFGEIAVRPFRSLEISFSGRYYDNEVKATVVNQAGLISASTVDLTGSLKQKDHGFTPKATVTLRPTDHFLAYLSYARGYRIGGINPNAGLLPTIPVAYDPDKVDSYEAGVKFDVLDRHLSVDATVFNIDWNGIQARLFGPAPNYYSYVVNAASANVAGAEFSGTARVNRNLSFTSNVTYQDAKLTEFLPDTFAAGGGHPAGTRLPGSSKWSVANDVTLEFPEMAVAPTFQFAHRYLSKAPVAFGSDAVRGGFSQFDARAGVTILDRFRLLGFVSNIFDKRGLLSGPFASQFAPAYSVIRPRTYGLRVDFGF